MISVYIVMKYSISLIILIIMLSCRTTPTLQVGSRIPEFTLKDQNGKDFNIMQLIGKKTKSGAIDVKPEKNDHVTIVIPLIVKYGYNIPEVALKVQDSVKSAVEESTDISIKDIIIKIKGVEK